MNETTIAIILIAFILIGVVLNVYDSPKEEWNCEEHPDYYCIKMVPPTAKVTNAQQQIDSQGLEDSYNKLLLRNK